MYGATASPLDTTYLIPEPSRSASTANPPASRCPPSRSDPAAGGAPRRNSAQPERPSAPVERKNTGSSGSSNALIRRSSAYPSPSREARNPRLASSRSRLTPHRSAVVESRIRLDDPIPVQLPRGVACGRAHPSQHRSGRRPSCRSRSAITSASRSMNHPFRPSTTRSSAPLTRVTSSAEPRGSRLEQRDRERLVRAGKDERVGSRVVRSRVLLLTHE